MAKKPQLNILSSALTCSTSFANLGTVIDTQNTNKIGIWLKWTLNSATTITLQAFSKLTSAATDLYPLTYGVITSGIDALSIETITLPTGVTIGYFEIVLDNLIPFIQLQVKDDSASTHATIDSCMITFQNDLPFN